MIIALKRYCFIRTMSFIACSEIQPKSHHLQNELCSSRSKYREGRRGTAVKVYTINQESMYLLVQGVPSIGTQNELQYKFEQYGAVEEIRPLHEYPSEDFTEVYLVKFQWFPAARTAKKHLDYTSFFGGTLHVCYAPEFETATETRQKLQERRKYVSYRNKTDGDRASNVTSQMGAKKVKQQPNSNTLNCVSSQEHSHASRAALVDPVQPVSYIWAGKEYTVYPSITSNATGKSDNENVPTKKSNPLIPRCVARVTHQPSSSSSNQHMDSDNFRHNNLSRVDAYVQKKMLNVSVPNVSVNKRRKYN